MKKYTPKEWRCFHRCLDGLKRCKIQGKEIRFLTLTLPACNCVCIGKQSTLDGDIEAIHDDDGKKELIQKLWRVFHTRLVRRYGHNIPYFSVRTAEGNGVIHVVLETSDIPFEWIQEQWVEIAGTNIIWINDPCKYKHRGRYVNKTEYDVARYLVSQYVASKQGSDFIYGYSRNWLYDGYSKDYVEMRKCCKDNEREPEYKFGRCCFYTDYKKLRIHWDEWLIDRYTEKCLRGVWDFPIDIKNDGNKIINECR